MSGIIPAALTVSNYREMLGKLAFYFWITCSIVLLILIPELPWLAPVESFALDIGGPLSKVPGLAFVALPALLLGGALAIIAHAVKLHDRLSNSLAIRERFDLDCIIWPLALRCGVTLSSTQAERIRVVRNTAMHECFYKYASSTAQNPVVSTHDIQQALTTWSWIWICLEARIVLWIAAILCALAGSFPQAFGLAFCTLPLSLVTIPLEAETRKYATSQIDQIASDANRRSTIAAYLAQV